VVLPTLFRLVLFSCSDKKFNLAAEGNSVPCFEDKDRVRVAPHSPSPEFRNLGSEFVSSVDVTNFPFRGTGTTCASPRFSKGGAPLTPISSEKFPLTPDGISTITCGVELALVHTLPAMRKIAHTAIGQILGFILSPLAFGEEKLVASCEPAHAPQSRYR
jgi:hypothetical protein